MSQALSAEQEAKVLSLVRKIPRGSVSISALLARADLLLSICEVVDSRFTRCRYCGGFPVFAVACSQNTVLLCGLCALERSHGCPSKPGCSPNAIPACSWASDLREFMHVDRDRDAVAVQRAVTIGGTRDNTKQLVTRDAIKCIKCNRREVTLFEEQRMCSPCYGDERRRLLSVAREEERSSKRPRSPHIGAGSAIDEGLLAMKRRVEPTPSGKQIPAAAQPSPSITRTRPEQSANAAVDDHDESPPTRPHSAQSLHVGGEVTRARPEQSANAAVDSRLESKLPRVDSSPTDADTDVMEPSIPFETRIRNIELQPVLIVPGGHFVPTIVSQIIASTPLTIAERNRLAGMSGTGLVAMRFRNEPPPTATQVHERLDQLRLASGSCNVTAYLSKVCVGVLLRHFRAQFIAKHAGGNWKQEAIRRRWTTEPWKVYALALLIEAHPRCELIDVRRFPWRQFRDHIAVLHREFDRLRKDAAKYERWASNA